MPSAIAAEGNEGVGASGPAETEESEEYDSVIKDIIDEFGLWENGIAEEMVDEIGGELINAAGEIPPEKEIRFILLDKDDVNAFAMADGHIFLFRGLVERTETKDQLASVMAHEMTHVLHKHHAKGQDTLVYLQIASILAALATEEQEPIIAGQMISATLIESYGRDSEVDADLGGADLMIDAGYDPVGMIEFFTYMDGLQRRRPQLAGNYFTIHPYSDERIKNLRAHLESNGIKLPDNIYRLHLALDFVCEAVDDHFECSVYIGDVPAFTLADDDGEFLTDRAFEVIHRLREVFNLGLRDHQVYSRERDGTYYIGALGSTIVSVTSDDVLYLESGVMAINNTRKEKLKFLLWKYYINYRI